MQSQSNQFINWSYTITGKPELFAGRGYTGHEYLPWFNLYNMNGRLYDPLVGRFLSPDPYIADLTSTQEYNRYSYCLNNPLIYSDPSGYKKVPKQEDFNWQYHNYLNKRFGGGSLYYLSNTNGSGSQTVQYYRLQSAYAGLGNDLHLNDIRFIPTYTETVWIAGAANGGVDMLNTASTVNTLAGYGTDGALFLMAAQEGSRRSAVLSSVNGRTSFYINSNKYLNKLSAVGKGAGYTFFGIGATISVAQFGLNPTLGQGIKSTADIIASYGTMTPAAPLSLIYFAVDIGFEGNEKSGWENVIDANVQQQIRIQQFQSEMTPFGRGLHNGLMNWY